MNSPWQPIASYDGPDREEVDVWIDIYASPRSMGWADAFRVVEAYRVDRKWFHRHEGKEKELYADYITHWMPCPPRPEMDRINAAFAAVEQRKANEG